MYLQKPYMPTFTESAACYLHSNNSEKSQAVWGMVELKPNISHHLKGKQKRK
jgi:hypothetical protein